MLANANIGKCSASLILIGCFVFFFLGSFTVGRIFRHLSSVSSMPPPARKLPVHFQSAPNTCGPAALLSICKFYGIDTTEKQIVSLAETNQTGTSLYGLAQAADFLGLKATGMELSLEELKVARKPLIAHLNGGHFVAVVSFHKENVTLVDPASGVKSVSLFSFRRFWKGYVLLLEPRN